MWGNSGEVQRGLLLANLMCDTLVVDTLGLVPDSVRHQLEQRGPTVGELLVVYNRKPFPFVGPSMELHCIGRPRADFSTAGQQQRGEGVHSGVGPRLGCTD